MMQPNFITFHFVCVPLSFSIENHGVSDLQVFPLPFVDVIDVLPFPPRPEGSAQLHLPLD